MSGAPSKAADSLGVMFENVWLTNVIKMVL